MDPMTVLTGLSSLGGIFGKKKKKYMDPTMYNQLFGSKAIGSRTQELVNQIINSPYGQQLMTGAAEQGQTLQTGLERSAAMNGFGPAGGAQSGASDFAVAAGPAAGASLQRGITSDLWRNAMPIAQGMVQREGDLALGNMAEQNAEPTMLGRLGQGAAIALSGASAMRGRGKGPKDWSRMMSPVTTQAVA
jgi:hypothetical protein